MRAKQTVIVRKSAASSRAAAERIARRHADRIYTSRETAGGYRFRQRPPSCFASGTLRTFCVPDGKTCIVYGTLKKGAEKRKACR
jgi:hypothetical protein